jgi:hypothetical protein
MCCLLYLHITHSVYIYMGFCVFVLCVVEDDISQIQKDKCINNKESIYIYIYINKNK